MSTTTCEERATQPHSSKLSRPPGWRRFFTFPALLVDYPATAGRLCAPLAPWKDEKSATTRHGWVFQQVPERRSGTSQSGRPEERPLCFPSLASRGPGRGAGKSSGQLSG